MSSRGKPQTSSQHAFDYHFSELHSHARAETKKNCRLSLVKFGRGYSVNTFCQSNAEHISKLYAEKNIKRIILW